MSSKKGAQEEKYGSLTDDSRKQLIAIALQRDNSFGPHKALVALDLLAEEVVTLKVSRDSVMALLIVAVAHCNAPTKVIKAAWLVGVLLPKGFIITGRNGMSHNFNNTAFHALGEVVQYIFRNDVPQFLTIIEKSGLSITDKNMVIGDQMSMTVADRIRQEKRVKNKPEWNECLANHSDKIDRIRRILKSAVTANFVEDVAEVDMEETFAMVPKTF